MDQGNRKQSFAATLSRRAAILLATSALAACGLFGKKEEEKKPEPKEAAMKPPPDAKLQITAAASPLVNPDLDGRPSPVVVRFYQLSGNEAFNGADFATLYENDEKALGKTMLGKLEVILPPGGIQVFSITKVNPETTFIGAVVGFRKFDGAKWRAVFAMQGKDVTKIRCDINRLEVKLKEDED